MSEDKEQKPYRGRIAPTPSGYLHEGHARTFQIAWGRARDRKGKIIFRNDDLDQSRSRKEFTFAAMEDLRAMGINWDEGPDCGGTCGPYNQSERNTSYINILVKLAEQGFVYPCNRTRKEIQNQGVKNRLKLEYLFPQKFQPEQKIFLRNEVGLNTNWRFRTKQGARVKFTDAQNGEQSFRVGQDFSDFLVWRKDGYAAYELATVVDDYHMEITEVVRGDDLLISSARQCLLFDALGWERPSFYHCKLLIGLDGQKLSKSSRSIPRLFPVP